MLCYKITYLVYSINDQFIIRTLLAQKLDKNISNDITFYLDSQISNEFMDVIVNELRSLKRDPVTTTSSQVRSPRCFFSLLPETKYS